MSNQTKFYKKAPLLGAGQAVDPTKPEEVKNLGKLLVSNNLEARRRANLEAGLTDPKDFLTKKTAATNKVKASAVDVVFVEAYTQIQTLTGDYEEARKKAYKIAMAYQDLMLKEVDKVFPSATILFWSSNIRMYPSVVHTKPQRYIVREKGRKIERTVVDVPESDIDTFYRALSIGVAQAPKPKTQSSRTGVQNLAIAQTQLGGYTVPATPSLMLTPLKGSPPSTPKKKRSVDDYELMGNFAAEMHGHAMSKFGDLTSKLVDEQNKRMEETEREKEAAEAEKKAAESAVKYSYTVKNRTGSTYAGTYEKLYEKLMADPEIDPEAYFVEETTKSKRTGKEKTKVRNLSSFNSNMFSQLMSNTKGTEVSIYGVDVERSNYQEGKVVLDKTVPLVRIKKQEKKEKSKMMAAKPIEEPKEVSKMKATPSKPKAQPKPGHGKNSPKRKSKK